jgi:hypothetical protein
VVVGELDADESKTSLDPASNMKLAVKYPEQSPAVQFEIRSPRAVSVTPLDTSTTPVCFVSMAAIVLFAPLAPMVQV